MATPQFHPLRIREVQPETGVVHEARILGNTDEPIPAVHEGGVQVSRANQVERLDRLRSALMG
ncbi:MAG: hypothetical protein VB131_06605, partial [Burkholderia gladioli]